MGRSNVTNRAKRPSSTSASSPRAHPGRTDRMGRKWGPTRLARGSQPPEQGREWLIDAVRARFPKLAIALGDVFDTMLADYLLHEPPARRSVRESGTRLAEY